MGDNPIFSCPSKKMAGRQEKNKEIGIKGDVGNKSNLTDLFPYFLTGIIPVK
jgi:hypothetical protein